MADPRACPRCRDVRRDAADACPACGGHWVPGPSTEQAAPGRLALLRRHVARGPPTPHNCPACRGALKAFDVPGWQHEGDLFWGLESPRPVGTCVAEGCSACGGVFVDAGNVARAGGRPQVEEGLARLARSLA